MQVITIGKRLIPMPQIALIEAFDRASNPEFQPAKDFKGRIVLLNRDAILTELAPLEFASTHGLHLLADDNVAVNRSIAFKVEIFEPSEKFKPTRPYRARLTWRDADGNEQSKLLITEPEKVVAELSRRRAATTEQPHHSPQRPRKPGRSSRKTEPVRG